jgi:hypothetical protein
MSSYTGMVYMYTYVVVPSFALFHGQYKSLPRHIQKQPGIYDAKQLIFGNEKSTKYTQDNTKAANCFLTTLQ